MTSEENSGVKRAVMDIDALPEYFPTHHHKPIFWEALGRVVATFGFLEEVLGKAIFAFTGTRRFPPSEVEKAYEKWLPTLERALSDPLGNLIDVYGKSVRDHPEATTENIDDLLGELRKASEWRNVLCHGSWRTPNKHGASKPQFVNKKMEVFDTEIDVQMLDQIQQHTSELCCAVINSVTHMGWQFPGGRGPGKPIS